MPADVTPTRKPKSPAGAVPKREQSAPPLERAQLVWRRARAMGGGRGRHDSFADALDLLRAAHHDPATMSHALTIGRTHLRAQPGDADAQAGAEILESAIGFLGINPRAGDIARHRAPR